VAYTPAIISIDDYPAIRALLGVDGDVVSDAEIGYDPFLPFVESQVAASIAGYATFSGADLYYLKTGVEAWAAARLCGLVLKKEAGGVKIGDYAETGDKVDWQNRAQELSKMAAGALGSISTRTWGRPALVVFAGPKRRGDRGAPASFENWLERIQPRLLDWLEEGGREDDG
jgi:hypothetical protein